MPHLIPYAGRAYSGSVNQNLLWQDRNVYLMDNHRAALWCWQQHVDLYSEKHSLIHIDRHYDALAANLNAHIAAMPNLKGLTISEYLAATVPLSPVARLFRWDNYISIYLQSFSAQLKAFRCLTHNDGDLPRFSPMIESRCDELLQNLEYWLDGHWIVNIDLDYFFCEDGQGGFVQIFSDAFIAEIFNALRSATNKGHIAAVTLCLTPSHFTPGWPACIELSNRIFSILGLSHPEL